MNAPIVIVTLSGSPIVGGSTEVLLDAVVAGACEVFGLRAQTVEVVRYRLNELSFIPCQACGKSPAPNWCLFDDALTPVYRDFARADIVILGSPIYFDAVSAQMKAFIDRCNCFRPPDYEGTTGHHFIRRDIKKRAGAAVLVGGERGRFDIARTILAGFFKWTEVECRDWITFESKDFNGRGDATADQAVMAQAHAAGRRLAEGLAAGV